VLPGLVLTTLVAARHAAVKPSSRFDHRVPLPWPDAVAAMLAVPGRGA
jgi:hypothetical protein